MNRKHIVENVPTNSMGLSSATPGSGPIDTFNPILNRNKVIRRFMTVWKKRKEKNSHDHSKESS